MHCVLTSTLICCVPSIQAAEEAKLKKEEDERRASEAKVSTSMMEFNLPEWCRLYQTPTLPFNFNTGR